MTSYIMGALLLVVLFFWHQRTLPADYSRLDYLYDQPPEATRSCIGSAARVGAAGTRYGHCHCRQKKELRPVRVPLLFTKVDINEHLIKCKGIPHNFFAFACYHAYWRNWAMAYSAGFTERTAAKIKLVDSVNPVC